MRKTHREPAITPSDETLSTLIQPDGIAPSAGGEPVVAPDGAETLTGDGSGSPLPPVDAAATAERLAEPRGTSGAVGAKTAWLTSAASEMFGPAGRFVDLTEAEAATAPAGVLTRPTADQLALRGR